MEGIFHSLHFWLIIAFVIAVLWLYKKVMRMVNAILSQKIESIAQDIKESKSVYNQSFSLINEKKEQLKNLVKYKKQFLTEITNKTNSYYSTLITKLDQNFIISKSNFDDYLHHSEQSLINHEAKRILEESIINTKTIIQENTTKKDQIKLINNSIKNIASLMKRNNAK